MESDKENPWPFVWMENGSFKAWFSWIEWLGLTAALIAGYWKTKEGALSLPIGVLALISVWFVFASGIAGFSAFVGTRLKAIGIPKAARGVVAIVASGVITITLLWSLVSVLMALLQSSA